MEFLQIVLSILFQVFRKSILDSFLQLLLDFLAHVAHLNLSTLSNLVTLLYEFLTALTCWLRNTQTYDFAIVLRSDTYTTIHNSLFDILDSLFVPRADSDSTGIRGCNCSYLVQRNHTAITIYAHTIEDGYISTTSTNMREFLCYEGCDEGKGYFISTYQGDGNPLPTFAGEPLEVTVPKPEEVWAALNGDNKVSLYTNVNGEVRLFNKNLGD